MFSHLLHFGIVCVLASQVHGKLCKGIKGGGCELLNTVVSGKCIYLCNVRGQVNFNSARRICEGAHLGGNVLSISNEFENELVKGFLAYQGVSTAFIGRTWTGYEWVWTNNDASTFVPTTTTTTTTTTTATTTTDAPREVALVVVIDATEQNGRHNALQEVDFANSLTRYILERGSAEFAFVKYGCYPPSFPPFHSTSSDLSNDMKEINSSIHKQCFQKQGRTFAQTYDDLSWFYYSNYPERLHISKNMAVIIFTSTNDSRSIADLVPMTTIPHSVVITISVGKDAADTSRLSVPQFSNHIAVNDLSDTDRLVEDVDEMIFTSLRDYREKIAADSSRLSVPQFSNHIAVNDLSSTDKLVEDVDEMIFTSLRDYREKIVKARKECTFVSFADRLWGHIECEAHRPILCEAKALEPPPPTTTPPSRCRTGFHYFPDTNKCYKVSGKRINFKTARDNCLGVPSRNPPELTSILSEAEMKMVHDLAYNIPNQGMFWIGLQLEDEEWKWTNGDFMNGTSYTNWATGYPREAPNSECVAYWMLSGWANTNCEDKYHAVCSYTPDLIQN